MQRQNVFVYGSLLRGLANSHYLDAAELIGPAELPAGRFAMISLGAFPALVPSPDSGPVRGELYVVDRPTLDRLDRLEGHPTFYRRELVEGITCGGGEGAAWVYVLAGPGRKGRGIDSPDVPDNDWRAWCDRQDLAFRGRRAAAASAR